MQAVRYTGFVFRFARQYEGLIYIIIIIFSPEFIDFHDQDSTKHI